MHFNDFVVVSASEREREKKTKKGRLFSILRHIYLRMWTEKKQQKEKKRVRERETCHAAAIPS